MGTRLEREVSQLTKKFITSDQPVVQDRTGRVYLPELLLTGDSVVVTKEINWGDGWRSLGTNVYAQGATRKDGLALPHSSLLSLLVYDTTTNLPLRPALCRYTIEPLDGATDIGVVLVDRGIERDPRIPLEPRHRSIAIVQEIDEANSSAQVTNTLAFGSNITAASMIIAIGSVYNSTGAYTISAPVDTLLSTYTQIAAEQEVGGTGADDTALKGFYTLNSAGGANTLVYATSDIGTDNYYTNSQSEWSGAATSGALESPVQAAASSTAVTAGNITPTQDNDLKISYFTFFDTSTVTPEAGWTQITSYDDNSTVQALRVGYIIDTSAVTEDHDWTLGTSRAWLATGAAFKVAGAAANKRRYSLPLTGHG